MVEHNKHPVPMDTTKLLEAYKKSNQRMFFMDYDGTLSPIVSRPEDALPSEELKEILSQLSNDPKNRIYIISGRDRKSLGSWLGNLRVGMSAEHGSFLRLLTSTDPSSLPKIGEWTDIVKEEGIDVSWRDQVKEVFQKYSSKLEGSTVECKEYAITFHYRQCTQDKETKKPILEGLKKEVHDLTSQYSTLNVLKGKKSVEARLKGITKGFIVKHILDVCKRDGVSFVFSAGDDLTDEDMYAELDGDSALKEGVFTCTVNFKGSKAFTYVENQKQILSLLSKLADYSESSTSNGDKN